MVRLPRSFYEGKATEVAPELLGKVLVRQLAGRRLSGRIVETEAYMGRIDPASHAYRGKTARNRVMFGPAGYLYVYVSYGMHYCLNVVTDAPDVAGAVLVRALAPLDGVEIMEANRGRRSVIDLCNGPGKLCAALQITRDQYGADLEGEEVWIEDDGCTLDGMATSSRVGVKEGWELPWRFYVPNSPYVSKGKPAKAT